MRNCTIPILCWLLALGAAASLGAQERFATEIRYTLDRTKLPAGRVPRGFEKALEEALRHRLAILGAQEGTVEVQGPDAILVRVPVERISPAQLQAFGRPSRLEVRALTDVQTSLNPDARYLVEVFSVQGNATVRFRDRQNGQLVPAARFLQRCPLLADSEDLQPEGASRIASGGAAILRVRFAKRAADRLERFASRIGRLMAIVLDGEILDIHATTGRPRRRPPGAEERPAGELLLTAGFRTAEEAAYLAIALNGGPLPVPLVPASTRTVAE